MVAIPLGRCDGRPSMSQRDVARFRADDLDRPRRRRAVLSALPRGSRPRPPRPDQRGGLAVRRCAACGMPTEVELNLAQTLRLQTEPPAGLAVTSVFWSCRPSTRWGDPTECRRALSGAVASLVR